MVNLHQLLMNLIFDFGVHDGRQIQVALAPRAPQLVSLALTYILPRFLTRYKIVTA